MPGMVDGAAEKTEFQSQARERNPTRAALIAAARRIAERDGMPAVSLSAAASEAGYAKAAAYAQFASKAELLGSVVAEDLGHLLRYLRSAAGLPEPKPRKPEPPSRVIRFELGPTEPKRQPTEMAVAADAGPGQAHSDFAPVDDAGVVDEEEGAMPAATATASPAWEQHRGAGHLVEGDASGTDVLEPCESLDGEHAGTNPLAALNLPPVRPSDLTGWFWLPREHNDDDQISASTEPPGQGAPFDVVEPASDSQDEACDAAAEMPQADPVAANDAFEAVVPEELAMASDETEETIEATAPEAATADQIEAEAPVQPTSRMDEPELAEDDVEAAPGPSRPPAAKLPTPEERILLLGPRTEETPELREVAKKLAPTNPSGSETDAEMITRLKETVANLETQPADRIEQRLVKFERVLSGMEDRFQRAEQATLDTSSAFRESLKKLGDRLEQSEERQRDMVIKIMAEVRDTARRVDELEFANRASRIAQFESGPAEAPQAMDTPPEVCEVFEQEDMNAADEPGTNETPVAGEEQGSYLAAVRRAVVAANAAQAAEAAAALPASHRLAPRTRIFALGFALSALTLVTVTLTLSHAAHGTFMRHVPFFTTATQTALTVHAPKVASMAPLDVATARAKAGDSKSELIIGLRYLGTADQKRDDAQAFVWLGRAAAKGDARAEYWLGNLYEHGRGTAADVAKAFTYYEKAALQGHRKAMHSLAIAYAGGAGVTQNYAEAARWFARAADLGYVDSAFNLAVLYERGDGVPQSLLDAYRWYGIAAALGDSESKARLEAISGELSTDDRTAADQAVAAFKPEPLLPSANVDPTLVAPPVHPAATTPGNGHPG